MVVSKRRRACIANSGLPSVIKLREAHLMKEKGKLTNSLRHGEHSAPEASSCQQGGWLPDNYITTGDKIFEEYHIPEAPSPLDSSEDDMTTALVLAIPAPQTTEYHLLSLYQQYRALYQEGIYARDAAVAALQTALVAKGLWESMPISVYEQVYNSAEAKAVTATQRSFQLGQQIDILIAKINTLILERDEAHSSYGPPSLLNETIYAIGTT